jgi:hypothetical protein
MYAHHSSMMPRVASAIVLVAAMVMSVLLPPATISEAADTEARLEAVIHQVTIHDDNEGVFSRKGEMNFRIEIWRCPAWVPLPCEDFNDTGYITESYAHFNASTGDVVTLDQLIPPAGKKVSGADSPPDTGFPVYAG